MRPPSAAGATWGDGTPKVMGTDVQPFYSGSQAPGERMGSTVRRMDLFSGSRNHEPEKPRRAPEPLFEPMSGLQRPHGEVATSGYDTRVAHLRSSLASSKRNGERLAMPTTVARGLGRSSQQDPSMSRGYGGYHQLERSHYMPKSIDKLRPGNKQRVTFRGRHARAGRRACGPAPGAPDQCPGPAHAAHGRARRYRRRCRGPAPRHRR